MTSSVTFLDANIFMYAAGRKSPQRKPCQRLLGEIVARRVDHAYCTSAEVLQEILHRYQAIRRPDLGFRIFDSVIDLQIPVLSVGEDEVRRARRMLEVFPSLSTRDAVHLGVMEAHGMTEIISYDKGFDEVEWISRGEP